MNKLLLTLAAIAALAVSSASAQAPPPMAGPSGPVMGGYPGYGGPMYGGPMYDGAYGGKGHGVGLGLFSGIFTNHGHKYEKRKGGSNDPRSVNTLPVASGGTLVFPQNPFIRSPRDFFMWDER